MGVLNRLFEMFVICISHFLYTFKCQHSDIFLQVDFSCTGFLTLADCTLCQFSPQVLNHTRYPSWIRSTPGIIFCVCVFFLQKCALVKVLLHIRAKVSTSTSSFTSKTNCAKFVYGRRAVKWRMIYSWTSCPATRKAKYTKRLRVQCTVPWHAKGLAGSLQVRWFMAPGLIFPCRHVASFVSWILLVKRKMQKLIAVQTFKVIIQEKVIHGQLLIVHADRLHHLCQPWIFCSCLR